jgi:hypothetical protein
MALPLYVPRILSAAFMSEEKLMSPEKNVVSSIFLALEGDPESANLLVLSQRRLHYPP